MSNTQRIGIDARLFSQTGVGTYIRNLLSYLPQYLPQNVEMYVYVLPEEASKLDIPSSWIIRPVRAKWHTLSEQMSFYTILMKDNLDLMHFTYFSYPVLYRRPFVATVHDLTPLLFKTGRASTHSPILYELKHRVFRFILKQQILHGKTLITPTQTVKELICQVYGGQLSEKIHPIHEGVSNDLILATKSAASNKRLSGVSPEYFLYVGNFYPHKNVERLIMAYKILQMKDKPQLVLAGPDNQFAQSLKTSIEQNSVPGIQFVHGTSDIELVSLYKHARALVNPSLSEGFGLPLLEAAYLKCPVIASDIPVFHELLGSSYTSCDPTDVRDIADALATPVEKLPIAKIPSDCSFKQMTEETALLYQDTLKRV